MPIITIISRKKKINNKQLILKIHSLKENISSLRKENSLIKVDRNELQGKLKLEKEELANQKQENISNKEKEEKDIKELYLENIEKIKLIKDNTIIDK